MTNVATSPGILSPDLFNQYADQWLNAVNASGSSELAASFLDPGNERILYVSFPIQQIISLVSTVGVRTIKARFLLAPDAGGQPHFTIALFATDGEGAGERLSAYYVADEYWSGGNATGDTGEHIPSELAAIWLSNWQDVPDITPALFATSYGPLQGYNFDIKDFVSLLFVAQPLKDQQFRIGLSLHEYYAANGDDSTTTQTFGLVNYLHSTSAISSSYYDMSAPCPPND
jgi:hypothetical protein